MNIDDRISNTTPPLTSDVVKTAGRSKEKAEQKGIADGRSVKVEISSTAQHMSEDEARRERLNVIRQQLAEGSYNISGKDVANKILKVLKN